MNNTSTCGTPQHHHPNADRIGVGASILCAIHCAAAPILLLFLPAFGRIWAHPASHALVAILIVPLAVFSIYRGYKMHRRKCVIVLATFGILAVLIGAALPAFIAESPQTPEAATVTTTTTETECTACQESCCSTTQASETTAISSAETPTTETTCQDNCCPSAQISDTGEISIHVPPAAIVTTLGGLFLIAAHIGNLCACRDCQLPCKSLCSSSAPESKSLAAHP